MRALSALWARWTRRCPYAQAVTAPEALAILAAGLAAGTINTVVGSGSLITFPVLLAFGYPPVTANVSNNIGLVPGSISGAIGYREELRGPACTRRSGCGRASLLGGATGAVALLALPPSRSRRSCRSSSRSRSCSWSSAAARPRWRRQARAARRTAAGSACRGVFVAGVYGGYFGAAQGILLLGDPRAHAPDGLQRINALKNVLAGLVNGVAAIVFVLVAHVAWAPAALIAVGSIAGGLLGARFGRRLPPAGLRALIVVVGVTAIVVLLTR